MFCFVLLNFLFDVSEIHVSFFLTSSVVKYGISYRGIKIISLCVNMKLLESSLVYKLFGIICTPLTKVDKIPYKKV